MKNNCIDLHYFSADNLLNVQCVMHIMPELSVSGFLNKSFFQCSCTLMNNQEITINMAVCICIEYVLCIYANPYFM